MLDQHPANIEQMEEDLKTSAKETLHLHKKIYPIPGLVDADQKEIDEIDEIRLRAINAIPKFVGPM